MSDDQDRGMPVLRRSWRIPQPSMGVRQLCTSIDVRTRHVSFSHAYLLPWMVALRIMPKTQANPNSVTQSALFPERDVKIPVHDSHGSAFRL
jgi:hypothetical protein